MANVNNVKQIVAEIENLEKETKNNNEVISKCQNEIIQFSQQITELRISIDRRNELIEKLQKNNIDNFDKIDSFEKNLLRDIDITQSHLDTLKKYFLNKRSNK